MTIQVAFVILCSDVGSRALELPTNGVKAIIDSSNTGITFLFGPILFSDPGVGFIFVFRVLPIITCFASLTSVLCFILGVASGVFGFERLTFELILGYLFAPVAFVIGVPSWNEAIQAGTFLGQKLVLNEFVAYTNVGSQVDSFSDKTVAIFTFALSGFANFGSIAILIDGIGRIALTQRA